MSGQQVEETLRCVLRGEAAPDMAVDPEAACDFTLAEQNAAMEAQGVTASVRADQRPVLGETLVYVVAVVLLNEAGEVLMMQEAKESCAGKWYLPAGRIERGETICAAAERELLEETGLRLECSTMLMVESARGSWLRFVVTGAVAAGGRLKTPAQADRESLQAKWVSDLGELALRANDVTRLIERARLFWDARRAGGDIAAAWHQDVLPALRPHARLLLRLVVVARRASTGRPHVLLSERTTMHLPACELHPARSIHSILKGFMIEIFGAEVPPHRPHGLLAVEHDGRVAESDGACFTLLVAFKPPLEEVPIIGKCIWYEVPDELAAQLVQRLSSRNSTIPLHVIR